jgi:acyl-CoA thioesterase-1
MKRSTFKTCCATRLLRYAVLASAPIHPICLGRSALRALHSSRSLRFFLLLFSLFFLTPHPAHAAAQTILVFGDSLSAGYGVPREAAWASLLQQELRRSHPQYRVVNASISGETTSGGHQRIRRALQQHRPAILILELGANDGLRGAAIASIRSNLAYMLQQAHAAHARVLLLGMQLPPNYGIDYTAKFKALYPGLAQQYHTALVPFLLDGVAPEQFQADNLHPNAEAQPQLLHNVLQRLAPLLQK